MKSAHSSILGIFSRISPWLLFYLRVIHRHKHKRAVCEDTFSHNVPDIKLVSAYSLSLVLGAISQAATLVLFKLRELI